MIHTVWPVSTMSPSLTNGGASGLAARKNVPTIGAVTGTRWSPDAAGTAGGAGGGGGGGGGGGARVPAGRGRAPRPPPEGFFPGNLPAGRPLPRVARPRRPPGRPQTPPVWGRGGVC